MNCLMCVRTWNSKERIYCVPPSAKVLALCWILDPATLRLESLSFLYWVSHLCTVCFPFTYGKVTLLPLYYFCQQLRILFAFEADAVGLLMPLFLSFPLNHTGFYYHCIIEMAPANIARNLSANESVGQTSALMFVPHFHSHPYDLICWMFDFPVYLWSLSLSVWGL